jgi:hypothetical protein
VSACRHDLGWVYVLNYSRGYEMRCATCGEVRPDGMRPVRQPTYPPHMLIGAAIVLAAAVFLVGLVLWQMWLS